jgi:hypothetical protein
MVNIILETGQNVAASGDGPSDTATVVDAGNTVKEKRPANQTPKAMRMLSAAQARNPMKHAFYGGFRNIAFQVGVVQTMPGDPPNTIYLRSSKNDKNPLPLIVPSGVRPPAAGMRTKVTCSVVGGTDRQGVPYPLLVARYFENPNIFEAEARRTTELLKVEADPTESLNKQASNGNEVMLTGIVVKKQSIMRQRSDNSTDDRPSIIFWLRQDAEEKHVIPVICDKHLVENASQKIKFGSIVTVRGQYHTTVVPVPKLNDDGSPTTDLNGTPVYETDEQGEIKKRHHPFIYLTSYPGGAPDNDFQFSPTHKAQMPMPEWIETQINAKIRMKENLGKQVKAPAPERIEKGTSALVSKEEYVQTAGDLADRL